ncbi:unnamed protein product [Acanthoscelides obtectus]|nr:unnamed protein product [Acanthoscelides obtectus]CAK1675005.1 hypothetical protein AOBTE_LOCUS29852 [Acanthoscelides obtectus]
MLEHPVQPNSIVHFFNHVPASTIRLQEPFIQASESIISQHFTHLNSLESNDEKELFMGNRQDKSLDDTFEIGARMSRVTSEALQTTTSGPQMNYSKETIARFVNLSQDPHSTKMNSSLHNTTNISEKLKLTVASAVESKNVTDTTMAETTEESTTTTMLEKDDSSSTMSKGESNTESMLEHSTASPPDLITKDTDMAKDMESTTTDGNDSENTTRMLIVVV